jgi:uncharacterized protein
VKLFRHIVIAVSLLGGALGIIAGARGASIELPPQVGGAYSVKVKSMKDALAEIRFRSTVRQKFDYSCGSAAVATLLTHHYEQPITEEQIIQVMYARGNQQKILQEGFSLLDMKTYLESVGFKADGFEAQLEQIEKFGAPGIALIQDSGYRHFVVVKGIHGDKVLVGDPAIGARVLTRAEFEAAWVNHIFFLIHSHRETAKFNVAAHWFIRPSAALGDALSRESLAGIGLMRPDAINDF